MKDDLGYWGNGGNFVSKLTWVLLGGGECGPVYLHTQPFLFQKHLRSKLFTNNNIVTPIMAVPMLRIILFSWMFRN